MIRAAWLELLPLGLRLGHGMITNGAETADVKNLR
jgi:hypothetical protein